MQVRIVAFHQDEAGELVADLACGHRQHVRHQPPLWPRPWVLEDAARAARVGSPIECPLCDREADVSDDQASDQGGDPACWSGLVCPDCDGVGAHRAGCAAAP